MKKQNHKGEFNLSKRKLNLLDNLFGYEEEDVKEFIKRIDEMKDDEGLIHINRIKNLAGENLK